MKTWIQDSDNQDSAEEQQLQPSSPSQREKTGLAAGFMAATAVITAADFHSFSLRHEMIPLSSVHTFPSQPGYHLI